MKGKYGSTGFDVREEARRVRLVARQWPVGKLERAKKDEGSMDSDGETRRGMGRRADVGRVS